MHLANQEFYDYTREWRVADHGCAFSFLGIAWTLTVLQKECDLTDAQMVLYRQVVNSAPVIEILAYFLAVGAAGIAKGPYHIVETFVLNCELQPLAALATLAQGKTTFVTRILQVFDPAQKIALRTRNVRRQSHDRLRPCT